MTMMHISELIEALQDVKTEFGDVCVDIEPEEEAMRPRGLLEKTVESFNGSSEDVDKKTVDEGGME